MNLKQYVLTALAVSALTMPWAPGVSQAAAADASAATSSSSATAVKADTAAKSDAAAAKAKQVKYNLKFNAKNYTMETLQLDGKDVAFRAYRDVVYVSKPASVASESMSVFIPEAYFQKGGSVNGYTAKTAPIFLPNGVGGYMPGEIKEPSANDRPHERRRQCLARRALEGLCRRGTGHPRPHDGRR